MNKVWVRRIGIVLGVVVLLIASAYLLRHPLLRGLGGLLTDVDPVETSDAIVLLMGGEDTRPFRAAELFQAGIAPRIVFATEEMTPTERLGLLPSMTSVTIEVLQHQGVPDSAIHLLPTVVTSTRDEAEAIRSYLVETGDRRITVVTSPFHTARARYTLDKALRDLPVEVRMAASSEWAYDTDRWWESELGITQYGMEVLKWVYTLRVLN